MPTVGQFRLRLPRRGHPVALGLVLGLLLLGCAHVPPAPPSRVEAQWQSRRDILEGLSRWGLIGRIALNTADEGWHASLRWDQEGDKFRIQLAGPLGQGTVRLSGDQKRVTLHDTAGTIHRAPDPETLLWRYLGWHLPLGGLRYWVRGVPQPGRPAQQELDEEGRLAKLRQDGWVVEFLRYSRVDHLDLPSKVFLEHPGLAVRLVVSRWELPGA